MQLFNLLRIRGVVMRLSGENLTFSYGHKAVLNGISLSLDSGLTGLLGPNGAGKTTLLSLLATVRSPTSGSIAFNGEPVSSLHLDDARRRLGYLPQRFDLMMGATLHRNVAYAAWCRGVAEADCDAAAERALAVVDLTAKAGDRVRTLSGGQRQRLGIACAIAHDPDVLILDEPTVGLDPSQRVEIRSFLASIAQRTTVLLSTHVVDDIALLGAPVIVLNAGVVVYNGSIEQVAAIGAANSIEGMSKIEAGYTTLLTGGVIR